MMTTQRRIYNPKGVLDRSIDGDRVVNLRHLDFLVWGLIRQKLAGLDGLF